MTQAEQDIAYVRQVVADAENNRTGPASIYVIWAVLYFVGFTLQDVNPQTAGFYWMIAGPVGGLTSYWLGYRWAISNGNASRQEGTRHMLHWTSMTAAIFLVLPLAATGILPDESVPHVILLIVAFGLFTAGIYLVRPYLWVGLAVATCYVVSLFIPALSWTAIGALLGGCMLASAFFALRRR